MSNFSQAIFYLVGVVFTLLLQAWRYAPKQWAVELSAPGKPGEIIDVPLGCTCNTRAMKVMRVCGNQAWCVDLEDQRSRLTIALALAAVWFIGLPLVFLGMLRRAFGDTSPTACAIVNSLKVATTKGTRSTTTWTH